MKKILLFTGILLIGLTSQSQILISLLLGDKLNSDKLEFGLEGGLNWSNISGMETNNYARFFNLGFYFDLKVHDQWAMYTGVLVKSNLGVDKLTENDLEFLQARTYPEEGDYRQVVNSFLVPALAKYNFKNHIYIEAGPQFALRYKGYVEYKSDIEGLEAKVREDNKDLIKKMDVGVVGGIGYKLLKGRGWTFGVKYYHGFIDMYKNRSGTTSSSINLKLNVPIGVPPPKE